MNCVADVVSEKNSTNILQVLTFIYFSAIISFNVCIMRGYSMAGYIKFERLNQYFRDLQEFEVTLSFSQIEKIMGDRLADSAYKYSAYWSHSKTHTITKCWIENGYKLVHLKLNEQKVSFRKDVFIKNDIETNTLTTNSLGKDDLYPSFMEDEVNKVILRLCEDAGFKINFTDDIPEDVWARRRDNIIQLRTEYNSVEEAGLILCHELAHCIVDKTYAEREFCNRDNNKVLSTFIGSDCDRAGAVIYSLGELIAGHEVEKIFL